MKQEAGIQKEYSVQQLISCSGIRNGCDGATVETAWNIMDLKQNKNGGQDNCFEKTKQKTFYFKRIVEESCYSNKNNDRNCHLDTSNPDTVNCPTSNNTFVIQTKLFVTDVVWLDINSDV